MDIQEIPDESLDEVIRELESLTTVTTLDYVCMNPKNGKVHKKQQEFHESSAKIRFLSGGNRSGKTEGGVAEDIMHATGLYPDWYPQGLRLNAHNRGRVVVTDFDQGGAVFEEKLWKWLPRDLAAEVHRTVKGALKKLVVRHVDGGNSVIEILTHEQDDMVFEGWSGHWAHFDEPPPREKFIATLRGLIDFKGRCWLTLTPISEPWLYDEFVSKSDTDKELFFISVDIRDNPFLDEEYILWYESKLTEDEKEARLHGRFRHLTGLVYKVFDPSVHVIPNSYLNIDPKWPKFFVCDPHDRKPHFGIWATVDPLGRIWIIGEIKEPGTLEEFSKKVLHREAENHWRVDCRIGDPNKMRTPSAMNGLTFQQEFSIHGLHFIVDVNDDIALGHLSVAGKLSWDKSKELSSTNAPKLYFLRDTTREAVRYMQMYVWDEWRGAGKDAKDQKEKPKDKFKDFPDCIRYLVMFNPAYSEDEPDPIPMGGGGWTGYGA